MTTIIDQIIPFIYVVLALTGGGIFLKFYLNYKSDQSYDQGKRIKDADKPENKLDNFLDNLEAILEQRKKDLESAILSAQKDEQGAIIKTPHIKSLEQQVHWLQMASDNKPIIDIVGKPILKTVLGVVTSISRSLSRI